MYELHLSRLVASVRRLYIATASLPPGEMPVRDEIKQLLDRLNLLALVQEHRTIAIGGLQGVGKTALLRALYDLDQGILPESGGRDERTPIRVKEHDSPRLEAFKLCTGNADGEIIEEPISPSDLAVLSRRTGEAFAFELRVPGRYFGEQISSAVKMPSWLLLPGCEDSREEWNRRVVIAMKAAEACIFVTNGARLADRRHQQFLMQMKEQFGAQPLVVAVTGADQSQDGNQEVMATLHKILGLPTELIIASNAAQGGDRTWRERLGQAVNHSLSARDPAQSRFDELEALLKGSLDEALAKIDRCLHADGAHDRSREQLEVDPVIAAFDKEVANLRKPFQKALRKELQAFRSQQVTAWQRQLAEKPVTEKFWGLIGGTLKHRIEWTDALQQLFHGDGLAAVRRAAIISAQSQRYSIVAKADGDGGIATLEAGADEGEDGLLRAGSRSIVNVSEVMSHLDKTGMEDLRYLSGQRDATPTHQLKKTVELLPLLAIEAARLRLEIGASLASSGARESPASLSAAEILAKLEQASAFQKGVMKTLGGLLAIDFAADAKFDLPGALASALGLAPAAKVAASASVVGSALITAAIGIAIAASFTYHEITRHELKLAAWGAQTLSQWADEAESVALMDFDDGMELISDRLRSVLLASHGLDQRLGDRQKLAAARARCAQSLKELRFEIHARKSVMV